MKDKFALIVCVYSFYELKRFLEHLDAFKPGCEVDIFMVYNLHETTKNRFSRTDEEVNRTTALLKQYKSRFKYEILERDNVGEDIGAFWEGYNILKDQYKYYFFMNSAAFMIQDNWLGCFEHAFKSHPNTGLAAPQIGPGRNPPQWYVKTTWFAMDHRSLEQMSWPKPLCREDCIVQEHHLFYPHVKNLGLDAEVVPHGTDSLRYIKYNSIIIEPIYIHPENKLIY